MPEARTNVILSHDSITIKSHELRVAPQQIAKIRAIYCIIAWANIMEQKIVQNFNNLLQLENNTR